MYNKYSIYRGSRPPLVSLELFVPLNGPNKGINVAELEPDTFSFETILSSSLGHGATTVAKRCFHWLCFQSWLFKMSLWPEEKKEKSLQDSGIFVKNADYKQVSWRVCEKKLQFVDISVVKFERSLFFNFKNYN